MTKGSYMEKHPRSILAKRLAETPWDLESRILIGSGLISYDPRSNIYKALHRQDSAGQYCIGGRAGPRRNDGHYFAVLLK